MQPLVSGLLGLFGAFALAGCGGTAVFIAPIAGGGIIGLEGDHTEAMADARRQMSESCGGAYRIVGEGNEIAIVFRGRTITEYQIRYVCGEPPDKPEKPATPRE